MMYNDDGVTKTSVLDFWDGGVYSGECLDIGKYNKVRYAKTEASYTLRAEAANATTTAARIRDIRFIAFIVFIYNI